LPLRAVRVRGFWVELGELILVVGNGLFVHLHLGSFDRMFGMGVTVDGKLFLGSDPLLLFEWLN